MTTIVTTVKSSDVTPATFVQDVAQGKVRFYRQRSNDTFRHVPVFPEGTQAREVAEWVQGERDAGRTMRDIAAEMKVSVPTLRRIINGYLLTEEIESMDDEEITDLVEEALEIFRMEQEAKADATA